VDLRRVLDGGERTARAGEEEVGKELGRLGWERSWGGRWS